MSIERPLFYEGQILAAADLAAASEYPRNQLARHERALHLWGIALGLNLNGKDKTIGTSIKYKEISLQAGLAIDSTGREIVVGKDSLLSESDFDASNVASTNADDWYPVFLLGIDTAAIPASAGNSACGNTSAKRYTEGYVLQFGRPGDEQDWDNQPAPEPEAGPGSGQTSGFSQPPRVLLGFVQWDSNQNPGRFKNVKDGRGDSRIRYVGVQADVVAARSGTLQLRNQPGIVDGQPALIMDDDPTDGPRLRFGLLDASGVLKTLLTINAKGDVKAEGVVTSPVKPQSVQIESGIIGDGLVIPLPTGITEEQVSNGQVTLHISLHPLFPPDNPPPTAAPDWVASPREFRVDAQSRRVSCSYRWFLLSNVGTYRDIPGSCQYTVLASVPAISGGAA